jgi:hypothetical protein
MRIFLCIFFVFSSWVLSAQLAFEKEGMLVSSNSNSGKISIKGQFKFKNVSGKRVQLTESLFYKGCGCTDAEFSVAYVDPNQEAFLNVTVKYDLNLLDNETVNELREDKGFFTKPIKVLNDDYFVTLYFSGVFKGVK